MGPKFLSNKFSVDSNDIIILHGKVYEFYKDGSGKLIRSQDITDITIKKDKIQGKQARDSATKSSKTTFEINASQTKKNLSLSTEEINNSELGELEFLKTRLNLLLSEINKKCTILRNKPFDSSKEVTILSDDGSISMPILSPQLQRQNCTTHLEKSGFTSATTKLPIFQTGCKLPSNSREITVNQSSNASENSMPTLSPYYTTPFVSLPDLKSMQKNIDDLKLLPKTNSNLPSYLKPFVSVVPLSKSLYDKYSVNKTSKRNTVKSCTAAKRIKKANSAFNSSSEFINSPSKVKIGTDNKTKLKNVKNSVLSKKKSNIKNSNAVKNRNLMASLKKSKMSKKSSSSAKKKSNLGPKKKLIMSSSLWINRDTDSTCSSPESKKSSLGLANSDTSFSNEICSTPNKNIPSSDVCKRICSSTSSEDMDHLVITDSDECDKYTVVKKSQDNITSCTAKSTGTEFLTSNQSRIESESNYFTPPKNLAVLASQ